MAKFSVPVENSEYLEFCIRNYEEVVLILLLGKVELGVERFEAAAFLALELNLLL